MNECIPKTKAEIRIDFNGETGNAYFILGATQLALKIAGHCCLADEYTYKAQQGNFEHLIEVTREYVTIKEINDGDKS